MGMLDVKIEVSAHPYWKKRNQTLKRLKSLSTASAAATTTTDSTHLHTSSNTHLVNAEIESSDDPLDVPDELYLAAATNDVDAFVAALEQVSAEKQLDFFNIVRLVSPSGNTLLHVAVIHRCVANVKLLLYHIPALLLKQNSHGDTLLHLAVRNRDELLLIYAFTDFLSYKRTASFHEEWISMVGNIPEIEKSISLHNRYGNNSLHEAAIQGCHRAISKFIKHDAEAYYCINNEGKSPLYLTAEAGDVKYYGFMIQRIRKYGFKERSIEGLSLFLPAVLKTNKDLIDEILKYEPALIRLLDKDGKTPLHYAASMGSLDMVQHILGKKVEYAVARDKNGFLPIHTAAAHGNINAIQYLLKYGLGPSELLTRDGQNIVHVAATRGNNDVVRFVLKTLSLEGLINEADINGNTPLHIAVLNWHAKVVFTMTWDKRIDLGRVNREGFTPLDAAQHYLERPPSFD